ncbi:IBR finger domain-containing protein [Seiridium cupressi]
MMRTSFPIMENIEPQPMISRLAGPPSGSEHPSPQSLVPPVQQTYPVVAPRPNLPRALDGQHPNTTQRHGRLDSASAYLATREYSLLDTRLRLAQHRLARQPQTLGVLNTSNEAGHASLTRATDNNQATAECEVCSCSIMGPAAHLSCGHLYCEQCLEGYVKTSLGSGAQFPPRCCNQEIPSFIISSTLRSPETRIKYYTRLLEDGTPNKTYCSNADCGRFISPRHIAAGNARCPYCEQTTCADCKGKGHAGPCAEDAGTAQLLALGKTEGWQRCNACQSMVQRTSGCSHMSCWCGSDFCYTCGSAWDTCSCLDDPPFPGLQDNPNVLNFPDPQPGQAHDRDLASEADYWQATYDAVRRDVAARLSEIRRLTGHGAMYYVPQLPAEQMVEQMDWARQRRMARERHAAINQAQNTTAPVGHASPEQPLTRLPPASVVNGEVDNEPLLYWNHTSFVT